MSYFAFASFLIYAAGVGVSQSLMSLGGTLAAVGVVLQSFRNFPLDKKYRNILLLLYTWVIYSLINHFAHGWSVHSKSTLELLPLYLVLGFPLLFSRPAPKYLAWIFSLYSLAVLVNVGVACYQFFYIKYFGMGVFKNQIYFAYNLLPAFFFFTELARRELKFSFWKTQHSYAVSLVIFLGIFTTNNRMSVLLVLFFLALRMMPHVARRWGRRRLLLLWAGLLFFFVAIYLLNPFVYDKIAQTMQGWHDVSLKYRLFAWRHNLDLFLQHPIFGVGFENNAIDSFNFPQMQAQWKPGHAIFAHSVYLQNLADSGLVGFSLLFGAFWCLGRIFSVTRFLLLGMLLAGLTENIFNNSKPFHAFLFFMVLSVWCSQEAFSPQTGGRRSLKNFS